MSANYLIKKLRESNDLTVTTRMSQWIIERAENKKEKRNENTSFSCCMARLRYQLQHGARCWFLFKQIPLESGCFPTLYCVRSVRALQLRLRALTSQGLRQKLRQRFHLRWLTNSTYIGRNWPLNWPLSRAFLINTIEGVIIMFSNFELLVALPFDVLLVTWYAACSSTSCLINPAIP